MLCKRGLLLWSQMFDFIITMCNCVKFLSVNVGFMSISKPNSAQGKANTFIRKYSWLWLGLHCTRHCWPNCLDRNCLMSGHCIVSSPQGLHTMPAPHVTRGGAELRAFSRIGYKDRPRLSWPPAGAEAPLSWILEQTLGHLPHTSIRPQHCWELNTNPREEIWSTLDNPCLLDMAEWPQVFHPSSNRGMTIHNLETLFLITFTVHFMFNSKVEPPRMD